VVRWRCDELGIPMTALTATELRAKSSGVTTHADMTKAYPNDTDHRDPGLYFPMADFMEAVRAA
jgi:hypothetical protein